MNDVLFVQLSNAENNLRNVESRVLFISPLVLLQDFLQATPVEEWHHEAQSAAKAEEVLVTAQELVVSLLKHLVFTISHLLLFLAQFGKSYYFQSVPLPCLLVFD